MPCRLPLLLNDTLINKLAIVNSFHRAKLMPSLTSSCFLPSFSITAFILIACSSRRTASTFLTDCSDSNFTSPSLYETHLTRLLAVLVNSTPKSPILYTTSAYPNSSSPQVFGLAQCRPDATTSQCYICLIKSGGLASTNATDGCGNSKSAVLRSDYCLLRYSDQPFTGVVEMRLFVSSGMETNNSQPSILLKVDNIMKEDLIQAAAASSTNFAVKVTNNSDDPQHIYGMMWCSMDLKRQGDCEKCLSAAMAIVNLDKEVRRVAFVSCEVRYEDYQFFSTLLFHGAMNDTPTPPMLPPSLLSEAVPPTELPVTGSEEKRGDKTISIIAVSGAVALLLFIIIFTILLQRWKRPPATVNPRVSSSDGDDVEKLINTAIQIFDLGTIINATDNFAHGNTLGQSRFGPIYKGVLLDEQKIAVKRLSSASGQGLEEMKNEINFIAKLQHKNLVRLLGYCLEGDEKILVYEYLPNTSLDKFISDPSRRMHLDWEKRVEIMVGIARGIRYLHEDSHLKIVHRNLKASNILLDSNMNPKISDFGLAKIFGNDETERNTSQIVGTFEYTAPEYILHGNFSTKPDVFCYGVLVLEIITGKKESTFTEVSEDSADLLSYVWKHWIEGMALQVVDKSLAKKYSPQEALRSIQIGLLCVQQEQIQRPNMATVVSMLSSLSMALPIPSPPAFYSEKSLQ